MILRKLILGAALLLSACGGEGGSSGNPPAPSGGIAVSITPPTASIAAAASQQFACQVANSSNQQCTWTVQEQNGGTVSATGLYTAPAASGTYHVIAAAVADPAKTATATVSVKAADPQQVTIAITPPAPTVTAGGTQQFACEIAGSNNPACTWRIEEAGGGSVTPGGLYTAPGKTGTYHVIATAAADTTKTARATVTVTAAPQPVTIAVAPDAASILTSGTWQFACTVGGSANTGCTWTVREAGGGSVTNEGLYTAPDKAGVYQVVATAMADPSKSANATVVVVEPVKVSIAPGSVNLLTSGSHQFACTVTGSANTGCTWAVREAGGGDVTASGRYTAPDAPGIYHVVATSVADATKSATATVTVAEPVRITLAPQSATILTGASQQLACTVTGASNTACTWRVEEAEGGSVTPTGLYTAPQAPGTYHVVATAVADTSKTARATIIVKDPVKIAIAPDSATLFTLGSQPFTCTVTGDDNTACTWRIKEANGGFVSDMGVYLAPAVAGTYTVVATSVADPTKSAEATVVVKEPVKVSVAPGTATIVALTTQQFTCTVTGDDNTACTWRVEEAGGGSVTPAGLYTAPEAPGTYSVTATSVADPAKSATATVTVKEPVKVSISPQTATLVVKTTRQFACTVTGDDNTACTWRVEEAEGGSVTPDGLYTAPASSGTYHVIATSVADTTKTASAEVTVTSPVAIAISPTANLPTGSRRLFLCKVTGTADTGCTYSVQEGASGGSIAADGLYTAPAAPGTYHVVARSSADPGKTDVSTITVTPPQTMPWVMGYYVGYAWPWAPPLEVDMGAMTHMAFGRIAPGCGTLPNPGEPSCIPGTVIKGGGSAHDPNQMGAPDSRPVEQYMVEKAHDAGAKAVIMLGGMGDGVGFLLGTENDAILATFARNIIDYAVAHDYDGVDLDWEDELGINSLGLPEEETYRRLKALILALREEAATRVRYQDPANPFLLTFPGYAVKINDLPNSGPREGMVTEWQADVANMVDQYNLMSYGIGSMYSGAGWDSWFTSPIFGAYPFRVREDGSFGAAPVDLDSSIAAYVRSGVPRDRMGIGIGFYGSYFAPPVRGPRQMTDGQWISGDNGTDYAKLKELGYFDHGDYHFDEISKSAYRSYSEQDYRLGYIPPGLEGILSGAGYLVYENGDSIMAKGQWVRGTGVGGTIIWVVNYGYVPGPGPHLTGGTNILLANVKCAFLLRDCPGPPTP